MRTSSVKRRIPSIASRHPVLFLLAALFGAPLTVTLALFGAVYGILMPLGSLLGWM